MMLPPELDRERLRIREIAEGYGLDFFETVFEMVPWGAMNAVAAYGGFPVRYPHWRFGMLYEQMVKGYAYGLQKIYELVINNDPCYAYLLNGNTVVDQKMIMAHVYAHCDFFKNNLWFAPTNRHMVDELASHATRVSRYIDEEGQAEIEPFLDSCLSLENLIDVYAPYVTAKREDDNGDSGRRTPLRFEAKSYMDPFINPPEVMEAERLRIEEERRKAPRFPERPERDVLGFLMWNAPLKRWQRDLLAMIRNEAHYFAPQALTKVLNEGWACLGAHSRVFTDRGLIPIRELVEGRLPVNVSDGEQERSVYDWACFEDRETVCILTRRGFTVEGSVTHRVLLPDGTWRRLDELRVGDDVALGIGADLWPSSEVELRWEPRQGLTLAGVAAEAGVSVSTVARHKRGSHRSRKAAALEPLLGRYEAEPGPRCTDVLRKTLRVPRLVDERLAAFLGYQLSDGNISDVKRVVSFTTGDAELAELYTGLVRDLFGLEPRVQRDGRRLRVHAYSRHLIDFLVHLGCPTGRSAARKVPPEAVLRSPKRVVAAFLRAYFDGDGYAGDAGVILVSASERMASLVQLLLANFGILSTRSLQSDGCFRLHLTGRSAQRFANEIGFHLARKQAALRSYIDGHRWYKVEPVADEIVSVERGRATVYDMSVAQSHRYAAEGLIHHNSYWHSTMMTQNVLNDSEIIDYADRHAGTMGMQPGQINPYKLGLELFRDIEERWDKGRFGKEFDQCDDLDAKRRWDTGLGAGRQKIFEVRRIYNDVTFVDEFLTEDFCERQKLFVYKHNAKRERSEIVTREFAAVKEQLLRSLANGGHPVVEVQDANHANRGELLLQHRHGGQDLHVHYATETLKHLYRLWTRPVHIESVVDGRAKRFSYDGEKLETTDL